MESNATEISAWWGLRHAGPPQIHVHRGNYFGVNVRDGSEFTEKFLPPRVFIRGRRKLLVLGRVARPTAESVLDLAWKMRDPAELVFDKVRDSYS